MRGKRFGEGTYLDGIVDYGLRQVVMRRYIFSFLILGDWVRDRVEHLGVFTCNEMPYQLHTILPLVLHIHADAMFVYRIYVYL